MLTAFDADHRLALAKIRLMPPGEAYRRVQELADRLDWPWNDVAQRWDTALFAVVCNPKLIVNHCPGLCQTWKN